MKPAGSRVTMADATSHRRYGTSGHSPRAVSRQGWLIATKRAAGRRVAWKPSVPTLPDARGETAGSRKDWSVPFALAHPISGLQNQDATTGYVRIVVR